MTLSPAQRHNQRMAMERQLARLESTADTSPHLQLQALNRDVEHLRSLPTIADRGACKRDVLLPRWMPSVDDYLASGKVYTNPVFAWCIVWLFDAGDIDKALALADVAIEQQQPTPDRIKSNFPTFVADNVLAWAEDTAARGESVEPYFSQTFEKVASVWRLHEEITAKWFKFAGLMLLRDDEGRPRATALEDVETLMKADHLLAQAEGFYKRIGVGSMRNTIKARVRALTRD